MTNETSEDEELSLLSTWVIHFSLAGCTTSGFREKLDNPSNIHFWESSTLDESKQFDFMYFLTQLFLSKDIGTLQRILVEPEEIHELVREMASVRESLNESGEFDEANYKTEINRLPYMRCNFKDEKCVSCELQITDLFDPGHNLRRILSDLQTSSTTSASNATRRIEARDSFCVTSHNYTKGRRNKEDTQAPCFHREKGITNWDATVAKNDTITPSKRTEKYSPQITQEKSRKRRRSSCDRKPFRGKIPKMNTIDTYFKREPKKIQSKCGNIQDNKENGRSNSSELKIYSVIEIDSDSSIELVENELQSNHVGKERNNSITSELQNVHFQQDNICSTEKTRTSIMTPKERKASDTDICVTHENLRDCHAKRVTQVSVSKEEKLAKNSILSTHPVDCSESYETEITAGTDVSDSDDNTDPHPNNENTFKLDAKTRKIIRDWCGGDTFLTQDSSPDSAEEPDDTNNDEDNGDDINEQHNRNNNNIDDDDDCDPDDHEGHDGDKGESNDDDDDDSDDAESDVDYQSDSSDNIPLAILHAAYRTKRLGQASNNIDRDEDYVYDSDDRSDSDSDNDSKKESNGFKCKRITYYRRKENKGKQD